MKVLKYYPYRTGMVYGGIECPRENAKSLEIALHELNGTTLCNHACFDVMGDNGKSFGVIFTDFTCRIGDKVVERRW